METEYTIAFFPVDSKSNLMGKEDQSRLEKAKWYQKLLSNISPSYRKKFIDILPFQVNSYTSNDGSITVDYTLPKFKTLGIEITQKGFDFDTDKMVTVP